MAPIVNAWEGGVTDTGAQMNAHVAAGTSSVRLAVDVSSSLSAPGYFGPFGPDADDLVALQAESLDPNTHYYWAVEADGYLDRVHTGQFRTHPAPGTAHSFRFGHASCAGYYPVYPGGEGAARADRVSDHPVFDDIANDGLLFFLHGGDLHYYSHNYWYANGGGHPGIPTNTQATADDYRAAFDDVLTYTRQGSTWRNVPIVYMWDDHDYGYPGNSDNSTRDIAASVYRQRIPSYPLAEPSGAIYHSFVVGRVLFICWDIRYHRDEGVQDTVLGQAQIDWTEAVLQAHPECEVLVVQQGQNWLAYGGVWGGHNTERDALVQMFGDTGWLDRMTMLSGDAHSMGLDDGGGNPWGGFPYGLFSPLDSEQITNNPITPAASPSFFNVGRLNENNSPQGGRGQWGTVDVLDLGYTINVTLSGKYHYG